MTRALMSFDPAELFDDISPQEICGDKAQIIMSMLARKVLQLPISIASACRLLAYFNSFEPQGNLLGQSCRLYPQSLQINSIEDADPLQASDSQPVASQSSGRRSRWNETRTWDEELGRIELED